MAERGRPPNKPNLAHVFLAMDRGDYDDDLFTILEHVHQRQGALKARVLERVKEVFGPEAEIVVGGQKPVAQPTHRRNPNAFVEKATQQQQSDGEQLEFPTEDQDPLSHLDTVERQMSEQPVLDIEKRGAMISGLHSSDIAE